MINSSPILLLSTERSGTNLLRAIMSSHSEISSPPPFGIMDAIGDAYYKYLHNSKKNCFDELIQDSVNLTQSHLNPWETRFQVEDVRRNVGTESFWGVFRALNELYAESEKKVYWFSKEPGLFKCIYQLALNYSEVRFIYLVRDPRDVVASMLNVGIHAQNVYTASCKWRDEQRYCLNALMDPVVQDRIYLVKYEDLIKDSRGSVMKLMEFLGIDFEDSQLSYYKNSKVIEHAKKSKFWENLGEPIKEDNNERYKRRFSNGQIKIIEGICWNEMKAVGYTPESPFPYSVSRFYKFYFRAHEYVMKTLGSFGFTEEIKKHRKRNRMVSRIRNKHTC